jgi:hypothetical membrane protein
MITSLGFVGYFALGGAILVVLTSGFAALRYRGKKGELYSPLNHFVSELGELGVSREARLFNAGLLLGGLLLLPFILWLGGTLGPLLGWLGMLSGAGAGLALSAVGIFPMNDLEKHTLAAMTFFRLGLAMVFFFALAIAFQPNHQIVIPKTANILSLLAFTSYASFLLLARPKPQGDSLEALDPQSEKARPKVWLLAVVEWMLFFATIFWVLGMALVIQANPSF